MRTVAALYVDPAGALSKHRGRRVLGQGEGRYDVRGPASGCGASAVLALVCRLAGLVEARWGHRRGEDGGLFASALAAVRRWGGVLEHPAYSDAFAAYDLPRPVGAGTWQKGIDGGWSVHVDQGHFGHPARKSTWLYAFGVPSLPSLPSLPSPCLVSWCGNHVAEGDGRPRLSKHKAAATPVEFARMLIDLARGVK